MSRALATIALLILSNTFMTLAWYGHIAFKSKIERFGMLSIILLGDRPVRILFPSPGQPHRQLPTGRPLLDLGAQSDPRSHLPAGLHGLRRRLHEIGHPAVEPPGGFRLPDSGRLFHLPQIVV